MVFLVEGAAGLGLAFLLGVALAEWGKFRNKADKGFSWLALAGVWFLFTGSFGIATNLASYLGPELFVGIGSVFEIVGWIFALIGTLFVAYEVLVER